MDAARQPALDLPAPAQAGGREPEPADVPRGPIEHPDEDYVELETYEQDPADAPGPDAGDEETLSSYIRLAAGLYASGAAQAFIERRLTLQQKHGALAVTDLSNGPGEMARDLLERAMALAEGLSARGAPARDAIEASQKRLATLGALALALHDRLNNDLPAAPAREE